jgi:tRNA-uridine 2-sulfurtransferase
MNERRGKRVFVGMSGGVDSSVAAMLLKNEGNDVVGVFMRCFNIDGCQDRDAEDARRVAEYLQIPFYVWDFEEEYKKRVVEYMIEGYRVGITPNPDVMCNREIKFGLFLERALSMGADYVATGHYVRLIDGGLHEAKDKNKDQSYFLWTLTQKQLAHCLFPIGEYTKPEVRATAKEAGLSTAEKKDSQGICFLGKVTIADFLKEYIPAKRGEVLLVSNGAEEMTPKKIGEHNGAHFYTIGQRHIDADLRFPKTGKAAERRPLYISEKDVARNTITLVEGEKHPALYKKEVKLGLVNWISGNALERPLGVRARVRYRQPLAPAKLEDNTLVFEKPQKFVAVGQSAVWYSTEGQMLGGGVIMGAK